MKLINNTYVYAIIFLVIILFVLIYKKQLVINSNDYVTSSEGLATAHSGSRSNAESHGGGKCVIS
jgi:hypothetical protein